jgi:hypothetical protein
MTTPVIPSQNPADDDTVEGALRTIFRKELENTHGQLPAIVMNYDRTRNKATVRPLVQLLKTNGETMSRASIVSVPVLALSGAGFVLNFPLKTGDLGWIEASDRDISLFVQSLKEAHPNALRIHSFSDGRFIPDAFNQYTINSEDASAAVFQSLDGTVRIALDTDQVRVTAPRVQIIAQQDVAITAGTTLTMTAPAIAMHQTGGGPGATFTGSPVVMPDAIIGGVQQSTHKHGGVQTGGGQTGGPTN